MSSNFAHILAIRVGLDRESAARPGLPLCRGQAESNPVVIASELEFGLLIICRTLVNHFRWPGPPVGGAALAARVYHPSTRKSSPHRTQA